MACHLPERVHLGVQIPKDLMAAIEVVAAILDQDCKKKSVAVRHLLKLGYQAFMVNHAASIPQPPSVDMSTVTHVGDLGNPQNRKES